MPRYEFSEGTSNKFWEIKLSGVSFTTTYGKVGSSGQTTLKTYNSDAEAKKEHDKLIAEKMKKGYRLVGSGVPSSQSRSPVEFEDEDEDDGETTAAAAGGGQQGERYFEFVEGTSRKFWAISMDDTSVKTRYGRIGAAGQETVKDLDTKAAAFKEHDKLVAEKTKKGYQEKGAGGAAAATGKSNPELEKAIFADPYDRDAYMVYADWLQGEGDPRGELIALQIAGKDTAAQALLDQHASAFWGPLAEHKKTYDGKDAEAFTWRFGFIHAARFSHQSYANEDFEGSLADILEQLLRHPSGKFLTELTMVFNGDPSEDNLQDLIDALANKAPASLRKIHIGDFEYHGVDTEISWYHVGNLGKLWKAVPQLTHLIVQGGEFELGTIQLPNLKSAAFKTGGLPQANAKAIAKAAWPTLEELEIWYGDDNYGGDATVEDVQPLLDRTDLRALKKLGLKNAQFTDELSAILPGAKIVKQLAELDLSMGTLTDEGAQRLAVAKSSFAHLDVLNVSESFLSTTGINALDGVAKRVIADEQRDDDDPEYRSPAVGE